MAPREPPKSRIPRPSAPGTYRLSSSSIDSAWDDEPDTDARVLRNQVRENQELRDQLTRLQAGQAATTSPQRVDSEAPRMQVSATASLGKSRWWSVVITAIGIAGGGSILGFTIHATKKDSPGDKPTEAKSTEVTTTTVLLPPNLQNEFNKLADENKHLRACLEEWRTMMAEQDDVEREAFRQAGIDLPRRADAPRGETKVDTESPPQRHLVGVDLSPRHRVKILYQRMSLPKCKRETP